MGAGFGTDLGIIQVDVQGFNLGSTGWPAFDGIRTSVVSSLRSAWRDRSCTVFYTRKSHGERRNSSGTKDDCPGCSAKRLPRTEIDLRLISSARPPPQNSPQPSPSALAANDRVSSVKELPVPFHSKLPPSPSTRPPQYDGTSFHSFYRHRRRQHVAAADAFLLPGADFQRMWSDPLLPNLRVFDRRVGILLCGNRAD